jgi:galactokinase
MTGGGFGGSAIALTRTGDVDSVTTAIRLAFNDAGFREPSIFTVVPSQGARREE